MNYLNSISSRKIKQFIIDKALVLVLIFMILFMVIIEPTFLQWRVIKDILTQSSVKLIVDLGLLFPLLLGGTDLAGGRQVGLAAVIVASMSQPLLNSHRFSRISRNCPSWSPSLPP